MKSTVTSEIRDILDAVNYRPAVSVILPFEPKMSLKAELTRSLKIAADKVEREVMKDYPEEVGQLVMQKLRNIIRNLNYNTHKKSIAIYVSPVFEKILYLDMQVEEKIIVDESFEIRDLVFSKKQLQQYLVMVLSSEASRIFLSNATGFVKIVTDTPRSVDVYVNDKPGRVSNFSDMSERKEVMMNKFLQHIDNSLDIILNAYHLPLFILGTKRILGHFKSLTRHNSSVIEYISGNYEDATFPELKNVLAPYVTDWKKVKQKDLLNQLEDAAGKGKLAVGMKDVWKEAMHQKGRLLVVEKNYMYAAEHGDADEIIYKATEPYNSFSYIKDAVDDVMEKVLESGGDVEFVEDGFLKDYHHIALIKYY